MTHKKLFLLLLAAVVLILALGFMHSLSTAAVPAAPSFLDGEIIISERDSNEYRPAIAYNSIHNEYLVVWENMCRAAAMTSMPNASLPPGSC